MNQVLEAEYRSALDDARTGWDQPNMIRQGVEVLTYEILARFKPEEARIPIAAMKDRIWSTAILQAARADARTGPRRNEINNRIKSSGALIC
jgi:hypothetical protein